jgi:hypothetical protein
MRKLAPMFLTTTILAFAAGNALAMGDFKKKPAPSTTPSAMSTSATNQATPGPSSEGTTGAMKAGEPAASSSVSPAASPTVPSNTQNPQGMSYNDKSSSAPGTNAKIDSNSAPVTTTSSSGSTDATKALADDDKQALSRQASGERGTIAADKTAAATTHKAKKAKKKVAKADPAAPSPQ